MIGDNFFDWLHPYTRRSYGRAIPALVLIIIMFFQIKLVSQTFSEETLDVLSTAILGLNIYEWMGSMVVLWLFAPLLSAVIDLVYRYYKHGNRIFSDAYWGEAA